MSWIVKQQIDIVIFVNCNWVDTRWQQYSTHLHTNSTENNTINLARVRDVLRLCELYPSICLTTAEKAWKPHSQGRKTLVRVYGKMDSAKLKVAYFSTLLLQTPPPPPQKKSLSQLLQETQPILVECKTCFRPQ
jgi:hypothetical protein